MRKKEDIVTKNIVINPVFYNAAKVVLDDYCSLYEVKRRREFDNNYWALVNILQFVLYKKKPQKYDVVKKYSKYGAEISLNELHKVSGMRKPVFLQLMNIFELRGLVVPIRNKNGEKSYTGGDDKFSARATIYYIPLQLVLQMEKYEAEHGEVGECIEIQTSKNNVFYNKKEKKSEVMNWVKDAINSPYKDFRKQNTDWEQIDMVRISDIDYDEEKFLQFADKEYLKRCRNSKVERIHGRIVRYGWNHLKKCLRDAVLYHGEGVDIGADYHNADFRMLVILAWIWKDEYCLNEEEIERFNDDVKEGLYKKFNKETNEKHGEEKIKQLLLTFKNATNECKRNFAVKEIKELMQQHYPTITSMLMNYREIEGKNCLSVDCQNIEGYLMHQFVLPVLDKKFVDPFTMCDAVWIRKSLATDENKKYIENVFEQQFDSLVEAVKYNTFANNEQRTIFKQLIQNIKKGS